MSHPEKRGRYRLDDLISFEFLIISKGEDKTIDELVDCFLSSDSQSDYWLEKSFFELEAKHHNISALLSKVGSTEKQLFHYLNDKITLLYQHHFKNKVMEERPVNLSLSGMAFSNDTPLSTNETIGLKLNLLPHNSPEIIKADVISCDKQADGTFKIAVQFQHLHTVSEKRLSQHLLLKQAQKQEN